MRPAVKGGGRVGEEGRTKDEGVKKRMQGKEMENIRKRGREMQEKREEMKIEGRKRRRVGN